ncbi:MAG: hypothetical protein MZV64_71685 [Ignavibacteriales bacterium]|nr:hypothetical protein [Ignavibacteriales bacterium]
MSITMKAALSWDEYQSNQELIADNANMKGLMVRGAVKRGSCPVGGACYVVAAVVESCM